MSGDQLLEAVSYLTWLGCFAVLAVALGVAVISCRRWLCVHPTHSIEG